MASKENMFILVLYNSMKRIKTVRKLHCVMHFVATGVQKWTDALIKHGKVEGKPDSGWTANIITKIKNWI